MFMFMLIIHTTQLCSHYLRFVIMSVSKGQQWSICEIAGVRFLHATCQPIV